MSTTHRHLGDRLHHSRADAPSSDASVEALDMKLENEIIPVSDVDRAKQFTNAWVGGSTMTLPR